MLTNNVYMKSHEPTYDKSRSLPLKLTFCKSLSFQFYPIRLLYPLAIQSPTHFNQPTNQPPLTPTQKILQVHSNEELWSPQHQGGFVTGEPPQHHDWPQKVLQSPLPLPFSLYGELVVGVVGMGVVVVGVLVMGVVVVGELVAGLVCVFFGSGLVVFCNYKYRQKCIKYLMQMYYFKRKCLIIIYNSSIY